MPFFTPELSDTESEIDDDQLVTRNLLQQVDIEITSYKNYL